MPDFWLLYRNLLRSLCFCDRLIVGDFMRENFPVRYDYFRKRLIEKDGVWEINFSISGLEDFQDCWMCYSEDEDCYWFGLSEVKQSYNYKTAEEILNAKVFDGKSMCELWDKVEFYTVNGLSSYSWMWRRCWNIYTARKKDCKTYKKFL